MSGKIFLKQGKERPVRALHPWIFGGAIGRVDGVADGETVAIHTSQGELLGAGYYNSRSQITVRVWGLGELAVDDDLLAQRLEAAIGARERWGLRFNDPGAKTSAFRLVNAEADLLPGLIVDVYGPYLVLQLLTAGIDRLRGPLVELLCRRLQPEGVVERSDVEVRSKEGLAPIKGVLVGQPPPARLLIREHGLCFAADLLGGQKTGFYLDQRENRRRVGQLARNLATAADPRGAGRTMLNICAYTGAFAVYVAQALPEVAVTSIDSSADALELARQNLEQAGHAGAQATLPGDAFQLLRRLRDEGRSYDLIVLDPPKFAQSRSQVAGACRGYKDLNLLALKLLRPGGALATFSCSGQISAELFQQIVRDAAADAGRQVQVLDHLGHGPDHPTLLSFPEGAYLKGLLLQAIPLPRGA